MQTIITLIFAGLTILGAVLAFNFTGSLIVAILVAVIVVLLWKTFQVPLLILWDRFAEKHFPLPKINHFYEEGLDGEPVGGLMAIALGMRVLIITETYEYTDERRDVFFKMVEASAEALKEQYPMFRLRYLAVRKRKSPLQYSSTLCGEDGELIAKCYKSWGRTQAVYQMSSREKNRDLFLYDGGMSVNGETINYTAFYLFDQTLPVTVDVLKDYEENEGITE